MEIRPDALRLDLMNLIKEIDSQIQEVKGVAQEMGIPPEKLRDRTGNYVMTPLLLAKAQSYAALIQLQAK